MSQPANQPAVRIIDIASELGRTNYDALWRTLNANARSWEELTPTERNAWYQAALAVVDRVQAEQMALTERAAIMR